MRARGSRAGSAARGVTSSKPQGPQRRSICSDTSQNGSAFCSSRSTKARPLPPSTNSLELRGAGCDVVEAAGPAEALDLLGHLAERLSVLFVQVHEGSTSAAIDELTRAPRRGV